MTQKQRHIVFSNTRLFSTSLETATKATRATVNFATAILITHSLCAESSLRDPVPVVLLLDNNYHHIVLQFHSKQLIRNDVLSSFYLPRVMF